MSDNVIALHFALSRLCEANGCSQRAWMSTFDQVTGTIEMRHLASPSEAVRVFTFRSVAVEASAWANEIHAYEARGVSP